MQGVFKSVCSNREFYKAEIIQCRFSAKKSHQFKTKDSNNNYINKAYVTKFSSLTN